MHIFVFPLTTSVCISYFQLEITTDFKKFSFSQINGRSGILEQQNAYEIYALHNSLSTFNANLPSCYHYLSRNIFLKKSESQLLLTQGIPPFEFLILMRGHRL